MLPFTQPSKQNSRCDSMFPREAVDRELEAMTCRGQKDNFPRLGRPGLRKPVLAVAGWQVCCLGICLAAGVKSAGGDRKRTWRTEGLGAENSKLLRVSLGEVIHSTQLLAGVLTLHLEWWHLAGLVQLHRIKVKLVDSQRNQNRIYSSS